MGEKKEGNPTFRVAYSLCNNYQGKDIWSGDLEAFVICIVEKGAIDVSVRMIGYE